MDCGRRCCHRYGNPELHLNRTTNSTKDWRKKRKAAIPQVKDIHHRTIHEQDHGRWSPSKEAQDLIRPQWRKITISSKDHDQDDGNHRE